MVMSHLLLLIVLLAHQCWSLQSIARPKRSSLLMKNEFSSGAEYTAHLESQSKLPAGFKVALTNFKFTPYEVQKLLPMKVTVIHMDNPTDAFAAMFTLNEFPGGPILLGRERMKQSKFLQTVVINNKISNVCPGGIADGGYSDSKRICEVVAKELKLESDTYVIPSSTGIIGWRLPVDAICGAIPAVAGALQDASAMPAAIGICTTDRYPKLRATRALNRPWSIVGVAKGAGMIGTCV